MKNYYFLKRFSFAAVFILFFLKGSADEGMWIPSMLSQYNIDIMQGKGLRLSAEDIYSINQASLKDGVVIFGRGCTGGIVSPEGLVFTNHHCAFGSIQSLSSLEQDYLKEGFWAMSRDEEMPVPGLTATLLVRIEDVSSQVLEGINANMDEKSRNDMINSKIRRIAQSAVSGSHYSSVIKPFFYGNEYYMFIYEEFRDIRMVGVPPSSIGNFGADPDNWIWPRHTGDFAVFRIYSADNNKPAFYSPDNVPYKPVKFLSINTSGIEENDFTMILGYPASTSQYLLSSGVDLSCNENMVNNIKLREKRMNIIDSYSENSDIIRLQYVSKYKSISNAWKKWQGVLWGMNKIDGVALKAEDEKRIIEWINDDADRQVRYGNLLPEMYTVYDSLEDYNLVHNYFNECFLAVESFGFINRLERFMSDNLNASNSRKSSSKERFQAEIESFFKNYYQPIDAETMEWMLRYFYNDIHPRFHPSFFAEIKGKYRGDIKNFVKDKFEKSKLVDLNNMQNWLSKYPEKESSFRSFIFNDPLYEIYTSFYSMYEREVFRQYEATSDKLEKYYRIYIQALREMHPDKLFYPDANFTMRLTYGKIEGYEPLDAVIYHHQTKIEGKISKYKTGVQDYVLPAKLLELYNEKDYGRWADADGNLYTCFIASNHTSGGNSGSPVLDSGGHLIGLNFDRNWEGTMNDFIYEADQCRNISVDIRYVMFIIDKFAGAGHLIEEMELVIK
jgi:hypothetical protein